MARSDCEYDCCRFSCSSDRNARSGRIMKSPVQIVDSGRPLDSLLESVRACRVCEAHLPLGARPVLQAGPAARILIVGQAPGAKVHASGVPWDDRSGERLRSWMGLSPDAFYDRDRVAIIPMGFCYPGRAPSGDLPPRRECAPLWLDALLAQMPRIELTLLVGQYAQTHFLRAKGHASVTATPASSVAAQRGVVQVQSLVRRRAGACIARKSARDHEPACAQSLMHAPSKSRTLRDP
jgi:uracil-DNA glycosylase